MMNNRILDTHDQKLQRPNVTLHQHFFFQQNLLLIENLRSLLESTYQEYTGRRSFDVFSCSKGYDPL